MRVNSCVGRIALGVFAVVGMELAMVMETNKGGLHAYSTHLLLTRWPCSSGPSRVAYVVVVAAPSVWYP